MQAAGPGPTGTKCNFLKVIYTHRMLPEGSSVSLFVTLFVVQLPQIVKSCVWYHPKVNEQLLISHLMAPFTHSKLSLLI